jgi:hypothetical protein
MERLGDELERLDEDLAEVKTDVLPALAPLRPAWKILQSMQGWIATSRAAAVDEPATMLNTWLELCALVDLADKQIQLGRSLAEAQRTGWNPAHLAASDLIMRTALSHKELAALESCRETWIRDRDQLAGQVRSLRRRPETMERIPEATPSTPPPDREQIALLDGIGRWLLPAGEEKKTVPFGRVLYDAVTRGEAASFGDIAIGTPGWFESLRPRIEPLVQVCIQAETVVGSPGAAERYRLIKDAVQKHLAFQEAGRQANVTWVEKLRPLEGAINELMALFTPARWAYEDIGLELSLPQDGKPRLRFTLRGDDARAELVLNTAELNVFTLALFLLCSVRAENRLGLLVLDDPLQNMDELTVTTVARGLARVAELLPEHWKLLLLFHGEDDLERFRREVPGAVYQLPWLVSLDSEVEERIKALPESADSGLQPLRGFFTLSSRKHAVS